MSKPFNEEEVLARIKNRFMIHAQERELETKATQLQHLYSKLEAMNTDCANSACGSPKFVDRIP